jgi:hypothetical protein
MSSASQLIRATHDCRSLVFEASKVKPKAACGATCQNHENLLQRPVQPLRKYRDDGHASPAFHRLENIGIPAIAPRGCVPLGRLKLFLPYSVTFLI